MPNIPWPPPLPLLAILILLIWVASRVVWRVVWRREIFHVTLLSRERVAVLTGDGGLHIAGFPRSLRQAQRSATLTWVKTLRPGDVDDSTGRGYWDLERLSLSADQKRLAELSIEPIAGGEIDYWVELWDVERSVSLFHASDNFVPPTVFRGDDPDAPLFVRQIQEERSARWREEELPYDPTIPEPIVTLKLDGGSQGNKLAIAGWTTDGRLAVTGVSYWVDPALGSDDQGDWSDEQPWWGIVDPAAPRSSEFYPSGIGPLPAAFSLAPEPQPLRSLTLTNLDFDKRAGTLYVDGVEQHADWLASRVKGFSGPFIS